MARSDNWTEYACLEFLLTLLEELKTEGHLDVVTDDPRHPELSNGKRTLWIETGASMLTYQGVPGDDYSLDAGLTLHLWVAPTDLLSFEMSKLDAVSRIRDKIVEAIGDGSFRALDPRVQVEGLNVVDPGVTDMERDLSHLTMVLKIAPMGG